MEEPPFDTPETAEAYDTFSKEFSTYRMTARSLVRLADIQEGMTVVDLACGTGVATQLVSEQVGDSGKVYAVDISREMLKKARQNVLSDNVEFIRSSAEDLDQVVKGKVDRVVVNSAIWQMKIDEAFDSVSGVLKRGGKFAFNIPGRFFFFPPGHDHPVRWPTLTMLMLGIAQDEYGLDLSSLGRLRRLSSEEIEQVAYANGFKILGYEERVYQQTAESWHRFLQIPVMTEKTLPGFDYRTRMEILDKAYEEFDRTGTYPSVWAFFVLEKQK